jgi:hypothetical protein
MDGLKIDFTKAEELAMKTDYACFACEDTEEINKGDAGGFFLEGYMYALKAVKKHLNNELEKM